MAAFFLQQASGTALTTPVIATLSTTPKKGNLLIAVVNANVAAGSVTIPGFTSAISVPTNVAIGSTQIFYKVCDGTDTTSVTATGTLATLMHIHAFEFSGFNTLTSSVLDLTASTVDGGLSVTSRASGTTGTTNLAAELVIAAVGTLLTNGGGVSWTNSFVTGITTTCLMTAYLIPTATGAQSTTASWTTTQLAAGCIATFFASTGNSYYQGGGR
jgi:hypothetical protein